MYIKKMGKTLKNLLTINYDVCVYISVLEIVFEKTKKSAVATFRNTSRAWFHC